MRRTFLNAALLRAFLILVAFVVFLVNQTVQVVDLADRLHPALGTTILWGLLLIYAVCLFAPVRLLLSLPRPLVPPVTALAVKLGLAVRRPEEDPLSPRTYSDATP